MPSAILSEEVKPAKVRDHLSYSAIVLYQGCPLRYYFRYVAGLPEETVTSSLVVGSAIHQGLQFHFEQLLAGDPAPSLDTLLEVFWASWNAEDRRIRLSRGEDLNSIGHLADRLFRAFQASRLARPQGRILAVEEELRGVLVPGLPDLLARVDLIVETDQALEITDYKTSRSGWSEGHVEESADQLLLYSELASNLSDGRPLRLGFAVLTKTKRPELTLHPVVLDSAQVERTKRIAERVWRAIEAGHYYPSPSPMQCPTCPYRSPCRAWKG